MSSLLRPPRHVVMTVSQYQSRLKLQLSHIDPHYLQVLSWCICLVTEFLCTPKINTCSALRSFADMYRMVKSLSHLILTFPAEVQQGNALPLCFSSCKLVSLQYVLYHIFLHFCGVFYGDFTV
jgi:hypothetical protein